MFHCFVDYFGLKILIKRQPNKGAGQIEQSESTESSIQVKVQPDSSAAPTEKQNATIKVHPAPTGYSPTDHGKPCQTGSEGLMPAHRKGTGNV